MTLLTVRFVLKISFNNLTISIVVFQEVEDDLSLVQLYKNKCFENSTAPVAQVIEALKGERSILNLNVSRNM